VAGTVIVPWYATGFRADDLEQALNEIAAVALRYGASSYGVYRARDDRYKFQQLARFEQHLDWDRYWLGREMTRFRAVHVSWYQVPVLYGWWDVTSEGQILGAPAVSGNGHGNGTSGNGERLAEGESA
jgi:hypothetical protein